MEYLGYIIICLTLMYAFVKKAYDREKVEMHKRNFHEMETLEFKEVWAGLQENVGKYSKDEFNRAANDTKEIVDEVKKELMKNISEITKSIVWISGGALALVVTIFASDNYKLSNFKMWFGISFIFLSLSLLSGILIHLFRAKSGLMLLEANGKSEKISKYFGDLGWRVKKEGDVLLRETQTEFQDKFNSAWDDFRKHLKESREQDLNSGLFLELSITFLFSGILFFAVFGLLNLS